MDRFHVREKADIVTVLWLTGNVFDPPTIGMFQYASDLAAAAAHRFDDIHFVGRQRTDVPAGPTPENWTVLPSVERSKLRRVLSRYPAKIVDIWGEDYRDAVAGQLHEDVELVVIDHLRAAGAIDTIPDHVPVAFLTQNDEYEVKRLALAKKRFGPVRLAFWFDMMKNKHFEDRVLNRSSVVSCITTVDMETLGRRTDSDVVLAPPIYRGERAAPRRVQDASEPHIVLLGSLGWPEKRDNLAELLRGLRSTRLGRDVRITATSGGFDCGDLPTLFPDVEFVSFVDDLVPLMASATLGIIYEPVGGGFKMKALDYVFNRVPMVILEKSAEGLPLKPERDFLAGRGVDEVVDQAARLVGDPDLANSLQESAFAQCAENFDMEALDPFVRALSDVTSSRATL